MPEHIFTATRVRPARVRPARRGRWASAVFAAIVLAMSTLNPASATDTATPPLDDGSLRASVLGVAAGDTASALTPGTARTGDDLVVDVAFTNPFDAALEHAATRVVVGKHLTSREEIAAWLSGDHLAPLINAERSVTAPALPAGETTQWQATIPATSLTHLPGGTYGVTITLENSATPEVTYAVAHTVLTVLEPSSAQQPHATIIMPLVAPSLASGVLTEGELGELTSPTGQLTAVLDAVVGTPTTLAIDPAIGAAIQLRGDAVPSAGAWLEQLEALPAERFALQFADADIAGQAAAGVPAPLTPLSLAGFVPGIGSGAEDAPNDPRFFNTAALLRTPNALPGIFWPRSDASATELATIATYAPNALSLVASSSLDAPPAQAADAPATIDGASAVLVDSTLSRIATLAATAADETVRAGAFAELTALLNATAPEAHVVIAFDRAVFAAGERTVGAPLTTAEGAPEQRVPSAAELRAVLDVIVNATQSIPLAELRALPPTAHTVASASDEARAHAVRAVFAQSPAIEVLAGAISQPELLTGTEQARALQVLGTGRFATDDDLATALETHAQHVDEILASVNLDAPPSVQQISKNIELPIAVRNNLPYAVDVQVRATPEDIKLKLEGTVAATAAPHTTTVVKIPVEARVTSAKTSLTLQLTTPGGAPLGTAAQVPVSVHAQWESVGLIAMGVLIAGLLAIGVVRTIRRRSAGTVASDEADAAPDGAASVAETSTAETGTE